MNPILKNFEDSVVAEKLWRSKIVNWKFHPAQMDIYEKLMLSTGNIFVINCSRQIGKSFFLCAYAVEFALQRPDLKICYLASTAKSVKKIIIPRIREILKDCPEDLKPVYKKNEQVYVFGNNSEIHIAGTDAERAENIRGQNFHLIICDEAGFMDRLDYVVSSILAPMTLITNGRIILSSTPPPSPDHPFRDFVNDAIANGCYIKKTIKDNPQVTEEQIKKIMKDAKGPDSVAWRREYLAELITDTEKAVIPEATEELLNEITKQVVPFDMNAVVSANQVLKPMFYDCYTVADLGYTDNTGILFAYWDFQAAKLVIEDEALFNKPNTKQIAEIVKEKELILWNGKKPYGRYCDGNPITIGDLGTLHNLPFKKTRNDELEASVNAMRIFLYDKKVVISPKCKNLLTQLHNAIWDNARRSFARSGSTGGHYDLVAALMYLIRNVQRHHNPFPANLGLDLGTMYVDIPSYQKKSGMDAIRKLDNIGKFMDRPETSKVNEINEIVNKYFKKDP